MDSIQTPSNIEVHAEIPAQTTSIQSVTDKGKNRTMKIIFIVILALILIGIIITFSLNRLIKYSGGVHLQPTISELAKKYKLHRLKENGAPFESIFYDKSPELTYFQPGVVYSYITFFSSRKDYSSNEWKTSYTSKKTVIYIDGKPVKAEYAEMTDCLKDFCIPNGRKIKLKVAWNRWLEIVEDQDSKYLNDEPVNLLTVDIKEAERMDQIKHDIAVSFPSTKFIEFEEIPAGLRLLPGDLSSELGLFATGVKKSEEERNQSTCENYHIQSYLGACLLEKFGGYKIIFNQKGSEGRITKRPPLHYTDENQSYEGRKFLDFYILDASLTEIRPKLILYGDSLTKYDVTGLLRYDYFEVDNKTVILIGLLSEEELRKIKSKVALNNGTESISNQLFLYKSSMLIE